MGNCGSKNNIRAVDRLRENELQEIIPPSETITIIFNARRNYIRTSYVRTNNAAALLILHTFIREFIFPELLKSNNEFQIKKATSANITEQCVICISNFIEEERIVSLPCNHTFHSKCLKEWFSNNNTCPICKRKY